jgi:Holliday junction resolvase-like predicted endonuclease
MALLDEQIVEEWLNSKGFFTIRGLKHGVGEIDLLAINTQIEPPQFLHVEVQISFNPIGYIGGNNNAGDRTEEEIKEGVYEYFKRKFTNEGKILKRNEVLQNVEWQFQFVHAVVREPKELSYLNDLGVKVISYKDILNDLLSNNVHSSSSTANDILKIVRYMNKVD